MQPPGWTARLSRTLSRSLATNARIGARIGSWFVASCTDSVQCAILAIDRPGVQPVTAGNQLIEHDPRQRRRIFGINATLRCSRATGSRRLQSVSAAHAESLRKIADCLEARVSQV